MTRAGIRPQWGRWAAALLCGVLVFGLWPDLDLQLARLLLDPARRGLEDDPLLARWLYLAAPRMGERTLALCLGLFVLRWWQPRRVPRWLARRALAWVLVVLLGVGLVVHEAFKERVGRPRPVHVLGPNATVPYVPPFQLSPHCQRNCSFVSGHAAISFSVMAWGTLAAPARRRRWWWAGVACGLLVGGVRMLQGGHFLSDVLFAGLSVWWAQLVVQHVWAWWLLRRWRRRAALR